MRTLRLGLVLSASALVVGAAPPKRGASPAPASAQTVTGPIADYWVSVDTSSGFGAGMMGAGGGRPSMGAIMGMMSGRAPAAQRHVTLQLGSTQKPTAAPAADHFVPQGLGVGASLPLVTPREVVSREPSRSEPDEPPEAQRPRGRLLIFWGCGEHAPAGQPVIFDFSTIGQGGPMPDLGGVKVNAEHPPTRGRYATYGRYPNERRTVAVPETGSLVGAHQVRGDYSPDIVFTLGPEMDFMPPLDLANAGTTPGGGKRLTWRGSNQATGYHLMLMGAKGTPGRGRKGEEEGGADIVFWSSSAVKPAFFGGGLADYLPPAEVRRLVAERAVLPPATTECMLPAEVAQASPMGLISGIGYGPEQVFTDPPRPRTGPWNIAWRTKVRVKTTGSMLLGMPGMGDDDDRPQRGRRGDPPPPPATPQTSGDKARSILKSLRPGLPF